MIERILEILKIRNLSPAQFADLIGVQRSSISHLISGRNKPSLEFIQKLLKTFPELNSDWVLFGKGEMFSGENKPEEFSQQFHSKVVDLFNEETPVKEKMNQSAPEEIKRITKRKWADTEAKQIDKIVCFYKDHTFREYLPE